MSFFANIKLFPDFVADILAQDPIKEKFQANMKDQNTWAHCKHTDMFK
jgi:hypothetical protein